MGAGKADSELEQRLGELRETHGNTIKVADVGKVVEGLVESLKDDLATSDRKLYGELEALSRYIRETKAEITALRPDEVKDEYLPTATDELDAIIEATAEATNAIMDATENIEGVMGAVAGEDGRTLMNATTRIYEACGFQDITGQRITKVVKALKNIEDKVDGLLDAFGDEAGKTKSGKAKKTKKKQKGETINDEDLLNGPQTSEKAKSQEEIDALLASFD